jgi:hypothetical protein
VRCPLGNRLIFVLPVLLVLSAILLAPDWENYLELAASITAMLISQ